MVRGAARHLSVAVGPGPSRAGARVLGGQKRKNGHCVRSPSLLIKHVGQGCASGAKPTIIGCWAMTSIDELTPRRRSAGSTRYPQFSLITCR